MGNFLQCMFTHQRAALQWPWRSLCSVSTSCLSLSWCVIHVTGRRSSTSRCAVTLRATSSTTVSWSPMYAPENCVLLTLERSLSTGPAAVSVTGRSLLLRLKYGTVCRLTWENRNCHTASSGGLWRHFYSDSETTAHCELLNCAS